tara:strand:+ start:593 stop:1336 length:744 start_codon:yes stop_codon:yes gene_type:complete
MSPPRIVHRPSPNFDERAKGQAPKMLILHYTGMESNVEAINRLCDDRSFVSAHYVVEENGTCFQLVHEANRAWHAGESNWAGNDDINSCSIGIELCNPGHDWGYRKFPEQQMKSLISLSRDIIRRNSIASHLVLGHSDVAPRRKMDPGELFDWQRLAREGIGVWPNKFILSDKEVGPETILLDALDIQRIQEKLGYLGYKITVTGKRDHETVAVAKAFQRHFRTNKIDGELDKEVESILDNLLLQII